MTLTLDFVLHGQPGTVSVTHRLNDKPNAVGFDLLGIDFGDLDFSGFPVVEATTSYEGRGYRGDDGLAAGGALHLTRRR